MKSVRSIVVLGAGVAASAVKSQVNPLGEVLSLMDDLSAKVIKEGEAEAKAYAEYVEWCDDTSKNGQFAIDDTQKQEAKLGAKIAKLSADASTADERIGALASSVAQAESELRDATLIREKETKDFAAGEQELTDVINTLERASGILAKEMAKSPAALAQVDSKNVAGLMQALSTVLDAAAFPSSDQKQLAAFVQSQQDAEDDGLGAPAAAVYKGQSGGIVDVLEDLKEKAEGQLSDLRKAETNTRHNFEMLHQSLSDQLAADNKDLAGQKANKAGAEESRATAQGDLAVTSKTLANAKESLATAHTNCMTVAADHEATMTSRSEELSAIAQATKILKETSAGAVTQSYSFVQLASQMQTSADLAKSEVVTMIKQLAKREHSTALAQLASKIAAVVKFGSAGGDDPFGKVKSLIASMISKLEQEAASETSEKAYCDDETSKTEEKKAEREEDIAKMTSKIDQAAARSAELKAQVRTLQGELAALAKGQAEMDKLRQETHADFEQAKADLSLGLSGVRKAISVLRNYYGGGAAAMIQDEAKFSALMQQPAMPELHDKAGGAGSSIVGILEVVESDFAKNLAKEETEEEDAQDEYDKTTQENKVTRTTKSASVKYQGQEAKSLDKTVADISGDRETTSTELSAILEYYARINDRCIAKPETYGARSARRAAEIQGLKEALSVLENETAFVQRRSRFSFRGSALTAQ